MSGLLFGEPEIEAIRLRATAKPWAKQGLALIRRGLEGRRDEMMSGRFMKGNNPGVAFLELALCSRLFGGWYRNAVETVLREADDPGPFMFKQGFELALGMDFVDGGEEAIRGITQRILLPVGETFLKANMNASNIQTTYNLSLLCIGLLARRSDFIERVTTDSGRGFPYHIAHSVHPDGFWYEQCPASYHSGTLERLMLTRWIANRNGLGLGGDKVLLRMLDTMPGMAMQGGVLPLIGEIKGDSRPTLFRPRLLEVAYALFGVPWVGWALGRTDRSDLWSLLVGRDIGAAEAPDPVSRLFEASGLCVLKNGERETYWEGRGSGVTVSFGPHGDWHGHAGKLGIEYRYNDRHLVRDHGNSGSYEHPIHRLWYMTTLAHSTVVLDGKNQAFTWCRGLAQDERRESGVCEARLFRGDVSACTVGSDFAYPGCRLRRTLFLTGRYLLDVMECEATDGEEHTFDWLLHTAGTLQSELPFGPASLECANKGAVPSPPGRTYSPGAEAPSSYDFIREVEAVPTEESWAVDVMDAKWAADIWKIKGRAMRLSMAGAPATTVFKGVCPATPSDIYNPVILVRRRARSTVFMALHVPGDLNLELACLRNEAGTIVCRVSGGDGGPEILVKQNGDGPLQAEGRSFSGKLDFYRAPGPGAAG